MKPSPGSDVLEKFRMKLFTHFVGNYETVPKVWALWEDIEIKTSKVTKEQAYELLADPEKFTALVVALRLQGELP